MNHKELCRDYDGLRIQASALLTIVRCMEQTRPAGAAHEIRKLKGQIESEKEMNAILTTENETLRAMIEALGTLGKIL